MAASLNFSIFLTLLSVLCTLAEGKEFLVGGDASAWTVPSSAASQHLNSWDEANRFQVGDSLVWKYDSKKDSVLQVTRAVYLSCNTTGPLAEHRDGNTLVKLHKPGPYYFISGAEGACQKGEKLIVVVMSRRLRYAVSPAPTPAEAESPAVAPTSGAPRLAPALGRVLVAGLASVLVLVGTAL